MRALLTLAALGMSAFAAAAQDASRDRAELDLTAGLVLFQATPLSESIVAPVSPSPPVVPRAAPRQGPRSVRVVYPGPYGR